MQAKVIKERKQEEAIINPKKRTRNEALGLKQN